MFEAQISGVARKAMPATLATPGQATQVAFDNQGRMLVSPYQVRDLITTAYLSLASNTETTLLGGVAGTFFDLVQITCANLSTATLGSATSIQIDLRDTTGGSVVHTLMVNDDDSKPVAFNVPIPQGVAGNTWTAQIANGDISGTTIKISALFIQNA